MVCVPRSGAHGLGRIGGVSPEQGCERRQFTSFLLTSPRGTRRRRRRAGEIGLPTGGALRARSDADRPGVAKHMSVAGARSGSVISFVRSTAPDLTRRLACSSVDRFCSAPRPRPGDGPMVVTGRRRRAAHCDEPMPFPRPVHTTGRPGLDLSGYGSHG